MGVSSSSLNWHFMVEFESPVLPRQLVSVAGEPKAAARAFLASPVNQVGFPDMGDSHWLSG